MFASFKGTNRDLFSNNQNHVFTGSYMPIVKILANLSEFHSILSFFNLISEVRFHTELLEEFANIYPIPKK